MTEIDALKRLNDDVPPATPLALARARQRALTPQPAERRSTGRRRMVLAGALAGTLAVGFLVNDVVLPYYRGNVDHVLIGPFGIMAIETKRWAGSIRVRNNRWRVNGIPRGDVARQVTDGALAGGQLWSLISTETVSPSLFDTAASSHHAIPRATACVA